MVGMHLVIRLFHPKQVRLLEAHWRESRPDLVVSLVPNFDRALGESLRRAAPAVPLVTILTDLADYRRISGSNASRNISSAEPTAPSSRRAPWATRPSASFAPPA